MAADTLAITQPAISHAIKRLESVTGVVLWKKQGRKVQLTEAGHYLARASKRILPQLVRLDETLQGFSAGQSEKISIGVECYLNHNWLLCVLSDCLVRWSSINIDIKQGCRFSGINALINRQVDLLITPDSLLHPQLTAAPLFDYEQRLYVASNHNLATEAFVTPQQLSNEVLYSYPVEMSRLDIFNQFLLPGHCYPKAVRYLESEALIIENIRLSRGVACLPDWLQLSSIYEDIVSLKLGTKGIVKTMHMLTRKNNDNLMLDELGATLKKSSQAAVEKTASPG